MPYLLIILCMLAGLQLQAAMPEVALKDHAEAFATTQAPDMEKYNLKWGNLTTDLMGTASLEYNDNINETTTGRISDTIARFGIKSKSVLPLSELNQLTLDLDTSYRWYADHNDLNSSNNFLDVNPGSELAFKWWIKNWEFKLYDQLQYTVNSSDTRAFNTTTSTVTAGNTTLGQMFNRAGLEAMWDLNDLKVFGGYSRDDVRADKAAFRSLDRTAHTVYLSPLLLINPDFSLGVMSSYTWNNYRTNFQNDSRSWAVGPTFWWQATANSTLSGNLYWKHIDADTDGTSADTSKLGTLNGSLQLSQELNSSFTHSLMLARTTDFGTVTNATTVNAAYYLPVYQLTENLALKGRVGYEDGRDSDGPNRENYIRRILGLGLGYTVNEKLTTDLSYNYISQTSNITERPFNQNKLIWALNYDF